MSLSGNLQDVSVADAMQFIHLGGRTGTLTLLRGDVKAEIGFHQGRIVNASSPGTNSRSAGGSGWSTSPWKFAAILGTAATTSI